MKKIIFTILFSSILSFVFAKNDLPKAQKDSVNLAEYAGIYKFKEQFQQVTIELKDGSLFAEVDSYGSNKINKQKEDDTFLSTSSYGTIYVFQRNADKKIVAVKLKLMGQEIVGEKEK